eukprot:scaffold1717_cov117-Cylindrotheca_fusiformis.AAC.12
MTSPDKRRVKNFRMRDSSLATCVPDIVKVEDPSRLGVKWSCCLGVSVVSSAVGAWVRLCRIEDDMMYLFSLF